LATCPCIPSLHTKTQPNKVLLRSLDGMTVSPHGDRDRDRDRTTVIKERDEPREKVIVKEHEREPDRKVIIKDRD
jgi:hypothetical protein